MKHWIWPIFIMLELFNSHGFAQQLGQALPELTDPTSFKMGQAFRVKDSTRRFALFCAADLDLLNEHYKKKDASSVQKSQYCLGTFVMVEYYDTNGSVPPHALTAAIESSFIVTRFENLTSKNKDDKVVSEKEFNKIETEIAAQGVPLYETNNENSFRGMKIENTLSNSVILDNGVVVKAMIDKIQIQKTHLLGFSTGGGWTPTADHYYPLFYINDRPKPFAGHLNWYATKDAERIKTVRINNAFFTDWRTAPKWLQEYYSPAKATINLLKLHNNKFLSILQFEAESRFAFFVIDTSSITPHQGNVLTINEDLKEMKSWNYGNDNTIHFLMTRANSEALDLTMKVNGVHVKVVH